MPFLPFVLLLAWQALSRSASFALGWATALYFGQVPGRQGHILSITSLLAAAWVMVVIGFAVPIFAGAALEALRVIGDNFDVEPIHYAGLVAAMVLVPPAIGGLVVWGEFVGERSVGRWMRLVPVSYPASAMLGVSVLQMVILTPYLLFQRWRRKRKLVQVPLVMRDGTGDDDLVEAVRKALSEIGIQDVTVGEAHGPKAWPLHTVGFAARHLLGAVVRGRPMRLIADGVEILAYATEVSILGPQEEVYRVRAELARQLAFCGAYLTWSEDSQCFEDRLLEARDRANGDTRKLRRRLDEIQAEMDVASLNSEEWNVLYRLRLQIEHEAARRRRTRSR